MTDSETPLRPLPYQESLANYLRSQEPETWAWFAATEARSSDVELLRTELLKQTYRLEPVAFPGLFSALADAKAKLGLENIPAHVYQAQSNRELNAALYFVPGEVHIVLQGDVLQLLDPAELRGVLGHELAHFVLWSGADQRFVLTDRISQAMANDPRAEPSHGESARLMRLYTEIFADRGALRVTGDPGAVISGLIKMQTGLRQVDAASYVRQAEEVFARAKVKTEGLSHPEAFIRTRAVMLWADGKPEVDAEVTRMIEGEVVLEKLDLVAQQRFAALTRRWLQLFLRHAWFHTDAVRGHARLFFPDFDFSLEGHRDAPLLDELREAGTSVRDYFCYLLLDFAAVDPELEFEPLRAAFALTSALGWDERLESLVVKELKLKKREAQQLRAAARSAGATENTDEAVKTPADETDGKDAR